MTILEKRCAIAPSYAAKLVDVMRELQRRRAGSNVFAGRHGFITPRDLFRWVEQLTPLLPSVLFLASPTDPQPRSLPTPSVPHPSTRPDCKNTCFGSLCRWAGRGAVGYQQLAEDGFAVLGERLRSAEEQRTVEEVLEKALRVKVSI